MAGRGEGSGTGLLLAVLLCAVPAACSHDGARDIQSASCDDLLARWVAIVNATDTSCQMDQDCFVPGKLAPTTCDVGPVVVRAVNEAAYSRTEAPSLLNELIDRCRGYLNGGADQEVYGRCGQGQCYVNSQGCIGTPPPPPDAGPADAGPADAGPADASPP